MGTIEFTFEITNKIRITVRIKNVIYNPSILVNLLLIKSFFDNGIV